MRKTIKKIMSLVLIMSIMIGVVAGCAKDNKKDEIETDSKIVTDMSGRDVKIPNNIKSIGTLGSVGVLNAFVELMGEGDKIANNMPPRFTKNDKWKMQYEFAPQIKDKPLYEDKNGELLIETIIEENPDVCLTMSKENIKLLEEKNIPVIYLEWTKAEDIKKAVDLMGEVLNKEEIAKKYELYFNDQVKKAEDLTKDISDKKKVLYTNFDNLAQPHLVAEWWINLAGGESVTDNGRTDETFKFTLEDIIKWNPDDLVLTSEKQIEDIKNQEQLRDVKAIKESNIFVTPTVAHVWGNRTVEQPLTIFWMMNKLYPEIMSKEELNKEIKEFYKEFFKYEISDKQIEELIK